MFHDIDQGQTNKTVVGVSARVVEPVGVDKGVAALGGGAVIHKFFKTMTVPGYGRIEPWVDTGIDVNNRSDGTVRGTVGVKRALI